MRNKNELLKSFYMNRNSIVFREEWELKKKRLFYNIIVAIENDLEKPKIKLTRGNCTYVTV